MRASGHQRIVRGALAFTLVVAIPVTLSGCSTLEKRPETNDPLVQEQEYIEDRDQNEWGASPAEDNEELSFDDIPDNAVISADELAELLQSGQPITVVDIRSRADYEYAFIENSKNIPAGRQLEIRMSEIPQDQPIALIALKNERLAEARQMLLDAGYTSEQVKVVDGGMDAWSSLGNHVSSKSSRKC